MQHLQAEVRYAEAEAQHLQAEVRYAEAEVQHLQAEVRYAEAEVQPSVSGNHQLPLICPKTC